MAQANTATPTATTDLDVQINQIGLDDLKQALREGVEDFRDKPSHLLFLGVIYPVMALVLSRLTFGYEVVPLLFPLAAGFALLGPIAAIGLYELSRRREQGLEVGWSHAFGVLKSRSIGAILRLGGVLVVAFVIWLAVAMAIFEGTLGEIDSLGGFLSRLFTTDEGWTLILIGNAVGFVFAAFVLSISVISFPMLIDRDVSAFTAARTSVRAAQANPKTIAVWGLIIAIALLLGSIPLFVGLAVVMPVFGHASWHLYRRLVAR